MNAFMMSVLDGLTQILRLMFLLEWDALMRIMLVN